VGAISDFPSQELSVPWPDGERDAGRVMLSRHFVGPTPFTVASIYGFPAGPTWPRNRSLTEQLLTTVTKEVVLGTSGCRIIQGDFNQPADGLDAFQIWRHYGWVEAQCLAKDLWGRHIEATCKNASTVDLMWLSPEAAMLCVQVGTMDVFADHLTVYADFQLPLRAMTITRWPLPSIIDWTQVDMDRWQHTCAADHGPRFAGGDPMLFWHNGRIIGNPLFMMPFKINQMADCLLVVLAALNGPSPVDHLYFLQLPNPRGREKFTCTTIWFPWQCISGSNS
jgi:hypothetical protein